MIKPHKTINLNEVFNEQHYVIKHSSLNVYYQISTGDWVSRSKASRFTGAQLQVLTLDHIPRYGQLERVK